MKMEDTYQKTMPSQEDGKKSEEKSTQTSDQALAMWDNIVTLDNFGNTSTSNKNKSVVVPVQGLEFKIQKV
jgi:hypothetical protein